MSKIIKHIHQSIGMFNGTLYFTLNNKLLTIDVITPSFNDFYEWRLQEMSISEEDYKPSENTIELTPFKMKDIIISDAEAEFISLSYTDEGAIINLDHPFRYLGENLLVSVKKNGELKHQINKSDGLDSTGCPQSVLDVEVTYSDWQAYPDIMCKQGMYNILIQIMEGLVAEYK